MKYMVMECHPGYAVVLDEKGQFTKVANMRYEVGQTVTDVVPLQISAAQAVSAEKRNVRWLYSLAAVAACLLLFLMPGIMRPQTAHASVHMTINPEVRIDVDQNDRVMALESVNADGMTLIHGYDYEKKNLDLVVDELIDRAIEMGFLLEGGKVTLMLDAQDQNWVAFHNESLTHHLNEHLNDKMSVTVEVCNKHSNSSTIPVEADDDDDCGEYGNAHEGRDEEAHHDNNHHDVSDDGTDTDNHHGTHHSKE